MPLVTPKTSAASNVDGNITVEARVETKTFNAQVAGMVASAKKSFSGLMSGIGNTLLLGLVGVASVIKTIISLVIGMGLALIGVVILLNRFGERLFSTFERAIDKTSPYFKLLEQLRGQFDALRGAVFSVFATLFQAALPYIVQFVAWLTTALDLVNQILGAMLGQKTVLKGIVKDTKEEEKSKKNTLAAFDKIDVLQKEQAAAQPDQNSLSFIQEPIKKSISDWVTDFKKGFSEAWTWLQQKWQDFEESPIGKFFKFLLDKLKELGQWIKDHPEEFGKFIGIIAVLGVALLALAVIVGIVILAVVALSAIIDGAIAVFAFLVSPIGLVILAIVALIAIIILLVTHWDLVKKAGKEAWAQVQKDWKDAGDWFKSKVIDPIKAAFQSTWDAIKTGFKAAWDGIVLAGKLAVNGVIGIINGMIRAVVGGINAIIGALNSIQLTVPSWIPGFGGQSFGVNIPIVNTPQIPQLAQGAVIPPNAQFLAVLGDQKSGKNIETPESLLRQIVQEELSNQTQTINVTATLDGEVIWRNQQRVQLRRGKSLIASGNIA